MKNKWPFFHKGRQKLKQRIKNKRHYSVNLVRTKNQFFLNSITEDKRIKATFRCPPEYKNEFCHSIAQVTVSLGKEVHEGNKLISTLGIVNENFQSCVIMLDDTLQWYTNAILKSHLPPRILIQEAYEAGNDWLSRNKKAYEMLTIPYRIVRWDDLVLDKEFSPTLTEVMEAYYKNPDFQRAINENIIEFLNRVEKKNLPNYDRKQAFALCLRYLFEECAGMIMWAKKHNCHFEIYPNGRNSAMEATHKFFIQPRYSNLLLPVGVRFSKRNLDPAYCQQISEEDDLSDQSNLKINF